MIVSRATSVYVIMVAVLVGGLWLILSLGSTLLPPTDLAGKWELTGPDGPTDLTVQQSGKFVDLAMTGWKADLKISQDANQNPISQQSATGKGEIVLVGNGQTVSFENLGITDQCTIRFGGSKAAVYQAHRVSRAFH
jgi:hypothetical protein